MIGEWDLVQLGFDKKVIDISESTVDSWNRHWYEDHRGNYIMVWNEFWDHNELTESHFLRIVLKVKDEWVKWKGDISTKEDLEKVLKEQGYGEL